MLVDGQIIVRDSRVVALDHVAGQTICVGLLPIVDARPRQVKIRVVIFKEELASKFVLPVGGPEVMEERKEASPPPGGQIAGTQRRHRG